MVNPQLQQLRGVSRFLVIMYTNVHSHLAMCIVSRKRKWYRGDVFATRRVINRELGQYLKSICEKYDFNGVKFGHYKEPQELNAKKVMRISSSHAIFSNILP